MVQINFIYMYIFLGNGGELTKIFPSPRHLYSFSRWKGSRKLAVSVSVSCYNAVMCGCMRVVTVLRPVMPKCAGTNGSKTNEDDVSMLKLACSGRYSESLKLSSRRLECAGSKRSFLTFDFDHTGNERFGSVPRSNTCEIWWIYLWAIMYILDTSYIPYHWKIKIIWLKLI